MILEVLHIRVIVWNFEIKRCVFQQNPNKEGEENDHQAIQVRKKVIRLRQHHLPTYLSILDVTETSFHQYDALLLRVDYSS